jgi:ankyrin repeat protein
MAQVTHLRVLFASQGMDVDTGDSEGRTPLMWAAMKVQTRDPLSLLLTLNASINKTCVHSGNTGAQRWSFPRR